MMLKQKYVHKPLHN